MTEIPGLGTTRPFPSLGRFRAIAQQYFVVCDPDALKTDEHVASDGRIDSDRFGRLMFTKIVFAGVASSIVATLTLGSTIAIAPGFILGAGLGFFVLVLIMRVQVGRANRRIGGRIARIEQPASREWAICEIVTDIAGTNAWKSGDVDRGRVVPGLAWRAVARALEIGALDRDLVLASEHDSLGDLVAVKRRELNVAIATLEGVIKRLRDVRDAAKSLDRRERDQRRAAENRQIESDLRQKLAGPSISASDQPCDEDSAEAIRFEAAVLNQLLVESDRIASSFRAD